MTEGSLLADYAFDKYKAAPEDGDKATINYLLLIDQDAGRLPALEEGATTGRIIAEAVNMARDLTNEPPDLATPEFLAESARVLASEYGFFCEVWDEGRIAAERMNCLLMVGRAAINPPRFIRMDYSPQGTAKQHICLIGKGLCYDSGGLSLKPAEHIRHMKSDMAGGAAVMAVMRIISQLHPEITVTGLIPTCENMIGGSAYKVDDILRARNGKTIEVDNTDAEGRLVLADALSYAAEQHFDAIIDIATLTGGCVIALARVWTGVMGNNQQLIDQLMRAGFAVGEKMWMLPFDKEVRDLLDSDIADMKNSDGREGSAIQGGMFLQEYAGDQPWVHLDIAGTSYLDKPRAYEPKGGTGVPVRALVEYLLRL